MNTLKQRKKIWIKIQRMAIVQIWTLMVQLKAVISVTCQLNTYLRKTRVSGFSIDIVS